MNTRIQASLRVKLIVSLISVVLIIGSASIIIGLRIINNNIVGVRTGPERPENRPLQLRGQDQHHPPLHAPPLSASLSARSDRAQRQEAPGKQITGG
jgi:hypothetical protein